MKKIFWILIVFAALISCKNKETPDIKLPALISDHMVLQQKAEVPLWGWGTPGTIVNISTSWGTDNTATIGKKGNWSAKIKTPKAGGPYAITIKSGNSVRNIDDVYIGEVWLASGQSNMEMPVKGWGKDTPVDSSAREIAASDIPEIRMFTVKRAKRFKPEEDCKGEWKVSNPKNTGDFSATAYFFAKNLYQKLNVPIGIIHSSWGGTPAEAWTSLDFVQKVKGFEDAKGQVNKIRSGQEKIEAWFKDLRKTDYSDAFKNRFKEKNDSLYSSVELDDSGWEKMVLPVYWETKQLNNFDGIVWFRKEFTIPKGTDLKGLKLYLGKIDDMDDTYVNGKNVGGKFGSGFWNVERIYPLEDEMLHTGKNTISVKVIDIRYGGGIYGEKTMGIINSKNDTIINLSGEWKFKPVSFIRDEKMYSFTRAKNYKGMPALGPKLNPRTPTVLYNGMIAPLIPFAIKGVIWYQGEANTFKPKQYETLFPMMINNWRSDWKQGDFPFYYVQIAPFQYKNRPPKSAAELRYAQFLTLKVKNTGMVVTTDIGNIKNIHPSNKPEVGRRLALWALKNDYGFDSIICSGPLYQDVKFEKNKAVISFTYTGKGLKSKGENLTHFEIAGKDSVFYKADAKIDGETVILSSGKVKEPKFVRFGWRDDAEPNLFNSADLPASTFRN